MGQSGMFGYSGTVVVEWNKCSRVRRLDTAITIINAINLFDSILLTLVVLFCSRLYFLVTFLILDGVLWMSGVEWGKEGLSWVGLGRVW